MWQKIDVVSPHQQTDKHTVQYRITLKVGKLELVYRTLKFIYFDSEVRLGKQEKDGQHTQIDPLQLGWPWVEPVLGPLLYLSFWKLS